MKSKTTLTRRVQRKTHPEIVETLILAKNHKPWMHVAQKISGSTRKYSSVNLHHIDKNSKEGDTIVVIGKVLGTGNIHKKIRVCALSFSASAIHKLNNVKAEAVTLLQEIKKNPKAEGVKIL